MSELQVQDLTNDSVQVRLTAAGAIADAVEKGTPVGDAVEAIIGLFADPDQRVRDLATYILQTDVDRDAADVTLPALHTAVSSERPEIRRGAAFLLAGCLARQENGAAIAALLEQPDHVVRLATLNALANGATPRAQTDLVVAALAKVLDDENVAVRKEAIWTLYLLGSEGAALTPAVAGLERALTDAATQANAAIAIALAWHVANDGARADALYASPVGTVQMGAAWGAADALLRRGDLAALKTMFASDNDSVRRGLGAFLHHARKQRRDLSVAGQAFTELETEHADDALLHARIYGVTALAQHGPNG
jgi:HEAT repeat protein